MIIMTASGLPSQFVKDYPLRYDHPPPPGNGNQENDLENSRSRRLPPAFIGESTRRYTYVPFTFLFVVSIAFIIGVIIMYIIYWNIISIMKMHLSMWLCILLGIINATGASSGLKILKRTIVSTSKLCFLHIMLLIAILLHIFIPMYHFVPLHRSHTQRNKSTDVGNGNFANEYWKCQRSSTDNSVNCPQILLLSFIFWGTLVLFVFLLVAWKASLWNTPYPVHPEAKTSSRFRQLQKTSMKNELGEMYRRWQFKTKLDEPYLPHFPRLNSAKGDSKDEDDDENSNDNNNKTVIQIHNGNIGNAEKVRKMSIIKVVELDEDNNIDIDHVPDIDSLDKIYGLDKISSQTALEQYLASITPIQLQRYEFNRYEIQSKINKS